MGRAKVKVAEATDAARARVAAARRLAGRLNLLPIAAFGLWSLPAKAFWLMLLGVIPAPFVIPSAPVWPWLVGALVTGLPAFLLPAAFHQPWGWEYRGAVYRMLGVEWFRMVVANGDMVNRFVRARHGAGYAVYGADAARLLPRSIANERRHIAYLCWGFMSAYYAVSLGLNGWALWLAVTNVGANLYPILLQRYSRARVMRLEGLRARRGGGRAHA